MRSEFTLDLSETFILAISGGGILPRVKILSLFTRFESDSEKFGGYTVVHIFYWAMKSSLVV